MLTLDQLRSELAYNSSTRDHRGFNYNQLLGRGEECKSLRLGMPPVEQLTSFTWLQRLMLISSGYHLSGRHHLDQPFWCKGLW